MFESAGGVKTDNNPAAFTAKVMIRRNVLSTVGKDSAVFDAFGGTGKMYSEVWKDAGSYTGCDMKPQRDSRLMFCADNRRVMRAIDLTSFNVIDLDSYGSPWEQAIIIAELRRVAPGRAVRADPHRGRGLRLQVKHRADRDRRPDWIASWHRRSWQETGSGHRPGHRRPRAPDELHRREAMAGDREHGRGNAIHRAAAKGKRLEVPKSGGHHGSD